MNVKLPLKHFFFLPLSAVIFFFCFSTITLACVDSQCSTKGHSGCEGAYQCCDNRDPRPPGPEVCGCHLNCGGDGETCKETNNSFPANPENIYLCQGNVSNCQTISRDSNNPTKIALISSGASLFIKIDPVSNPAGSQGIKYQFRVNNLVSGFNSACTPENTGDYCGTWQNDSFIGDLNAKILPVEGANYDTWIHTGTVNKCDNSVKTNGDANVIHGYFKINYSPKVVSVTPDGTGTSDYISGTLNGDHGPASICSPHNPQRYTVTYRDADGCNDINWAGMWIDDRTPDPENIRSSVHAMSYRGSQVLIDAEPQATGTCSSVNPVMQVLVDDKIVKSITVNGRSKYFYNSPTAISADRIKVRLSNDCYNGVENDMNLIVHGISLNGTSFRSDNDGTFFCYDSNCNTSSQLGLYSVHDSFRYAGSTSFGSNSLLLYGLRLDAANQLGCSAAATWRCAWNTPNGVGLQAGENSAWMYGASSIPLIDNNVEDSESAARWRLIGQSCSGNDLKVTYEVAYVKDIGSQLNVYGSVMDTSGAIDSAVTNGWVNVGSWKLDLKAPDVNAQVSVETKSKVAVTWSANDINKIISAYGTIGLFDSKYTDGKLVKNVTAVPQISLTMPLDNFSADSIWNYRFAEQLSTIQEKKEVIEVGPLDSGILKFKPYAIDAACNLNASTNPSESIVGSTWLITKGGSVYSGGDINDDVVRFANAGLLPKPATESDPTVYSWGVDELQNSLSIDGLQTEISTSLVTSGGGSIEKVINRIQPYNAYNPYSVKNYADSNNSALYEKLKLQFSKKMITGYTIVDLALNVSEISTSSSNYCPDSSKPCVIKASNDISIASGFVCDRQTLIIIGGSVNIYPDVTFGSRAKDGCIFLVKSNVVFKDGTNKSGEPVLSTFPKYDLFQLFVVADGKAEFEMADQNQSVSDGVKIDGSVFALGGDDNSPSVIWRRSLQLMDNNAFPSVALHLDPRYIFMAADFFEGNYDSFVKESGFKPY